MIDDARPIVVFGASGHGKVVCDILFAMGVRVAGFVDDDAALTGKTVLGRTVLGTSSWLEGSGARVALGIGNNAIREAVASRCVALGCTLLSAVHPHASVATAVTIGEGSVVMARAVVNPDARIGRGVIVNTAAVVEHDAWVGDFAHVSPNATMGGTTRLGRAAQLGIGATMLPSVCVGDGSIVGGGALVARDIPPNTVAMGVPARVARSRSLP